jgi:hypothetical protein
VRFFVLLASAATLLLAEIPKSVLAEHDLEKRSELALKEADDQITAASKAYDSASAEQKEFQSHLNTAGELAQLSIKSLQDSGKRASKSPKYFKRAEMKLRSLLRRIDSLEKDVSVDDRPPVEKVKILVSEAHEQVLHDIMSKR